MLETRIKAAQQIAWVQGHVLTIEDLPPKFNRRWTAIQKDQVLAAIEAGLLSPAEARARYNLSASTLSDWRSEGTVSEMATSAPVREIGTDDQLSRLVSILSSRGLVDDADVVSIYKPGAMPVRHDLASFMAADDLFDFGRVIDA